MINQIKNILGDRLDDLKKLNDKTARLGLQNLWELSEKHPFHDAGVEHDLAYLIAYDLVEMKETELAKKYVKEADKKFKEAIYKIADESDSIWLFFQARLFSSLVSSYSFLRF